jgi:hypothetical protein
MAETKTFSSFLIYLNRIDYDHPEKQPEDYDVFQIRYVKDDEFAVSHKYTGAAGKILRTDLRMSTSTLRNWYTNFLNALEIDTDPYRDVQFCIAGLPDVLVRIAENPHKGDDGREVHTPVFHKYRSQVQGLMAYFIDICKSIRVEETGTDTDN